MGKILKLPKITTLRRKKPKLSEEIHCYEELEQ